ncbi:hypothetical protein BHF84_03510 [Corynebacterium diphtheriae]|nr:hypothetical protein BHF73_03805 [Corynebacterium diphtheriae]OIR78275.1 hypothetical protein BHF83_03490 [Corynebacterium diphtheriae]OIR89792.1 hypothetical protein BHF87_00840 [Corynebacterium diphtheriae]OIS03035.1 hypothetical protein BHF97_02360 [Corynebacterium diphtheriae]OIS11760.1 hypothetical protein BHF98_00840 [Corynebacterium diphtheriae]
MEMWTILIAYSSVTVYVLDSTVIIYFIFCIVVVKYLDVIFLLLEVRVDILCFIFYKFAISEKSSI